MCHWYLHWLPRLATQIDAMKKSSFTVSDCLDFMFIHIVFVCMWLLLNHSFCDPLCCSWMHQLYSSLLICDMNIDFWILVLFYLFSFDKKMRAHTYTTNEKNPHKQKCHKFVESLQSSHLQYAWRIRANMRLLFVHL